MATWVHKQGRYFNYFVPADDWRGVESTSGIDISSATGDVDVSFAFVYGPGPGIPAGLQQAEAFLFQASRISNVNIVQQSFVTPTQYGNSQTIEFTGHWATTGNDIHGCLDVTLSNQMLIGYLRQAATPVWNKDAITLRLIRDHITYLPANQ